MCINTQQTLISFRDKWERNRNLAFSETLREGSDIFNWILERNGFPSAVEFKKWLSNRNRILDAGCGNGRVTALLKNYAPQSADIIGIDITAANVARENLAALDRVTVQEKDLLGDLSDLGKFDLIYCQEVLHHTSDPQGAFLNLCRRLGEKGEIAIYVYKLKAPIREYADDFIRDRISGLAYEQAMAEMRGITELGKALSELSLKVTVPDVKLLEIPAGEYDVQRLVYHFFLKCFWNPALSYEENAAINYDWYHPQICSRHTLEEVLNWFKDAELRVVHQRVDFYGITVRGVKS
jgi:SAM-dependent methyltransferase